MMNIVVAGTDTRASAIADLLSGGGYAVRFAGEPSDAPADVVVLAAPRDAPETPSITVTPETILVDAMSGHPDAETERALGRRYGTDRVLRALIVLPQRGANILCCSDDATTMREVERIFVACGCVPTNRGSLSNVGALDPDEALDDQYDRLKGANTVPNP